MTTLLFTHPACERHRTGPGHPERPERLRALRRAIDESRLTDLIDAPEAPAVARDLLEDVHLRSYIARVETMAGQGGGWLDPDTPVGPESAHAAGHAAGAAQRAAETLCAGDASRAFVMVRPPGHHALPDRGMGFCLYNNAAVAAVAARRAGRQRVMIVDWDVHHGNGTQAIFWRDAGVLFFSAHQEFWYPGTGASDEIGEGSGEGFTVNVPLPAQTGDGGYDELFTEVVLPLASTFKPDFFIVSAGYDAHHADPLGGMALTARGFGRLTHMLDAAAQSLRAPLLAVLEGGYDLQALSASVVATLEVLTGQTAAGAAADETSARTPSGGTVVAGISASGAPPTETAPAAIRPRLRAARRRLMAHWRI